MCFHGGGYACILIFVLKIYLFFEDGAG
uniref:Uncharacterized protein n=1 Tax=Rhizophora mucronata TaxID=61149 RepID=A0A2P2QCP4_RHIMU